MNNDSLSADLVEWLRAAIAEHERIARTCAEQWPSPWELEPRQNLIRGCRCGSCTEPDPDATRIDQIDDADGELVYLKPPVAHHVVANDPAYALRTVQAHREILDLCSKLIVPGLSSDQHRAVGIAPSPRELHNAKRTIRLLAGIYRESFPGFDPSWISEVANNKESSW